MMENAQSVDIKLSEQEVEELDQMLETVPMSEVFGGSRQKERRS